MPYPASARSFDEVSRVYDATREPLDPRVLDQIAVCLQRWRIRSLLEIGVGTGRVASPLSARGFELTGVDTSLNMMLKAREMHLERVVRVTVESVPFRDASFDGALFAHVLHVLEGPRLAIREAVRVARFGALALVEPKLTGGLDPFERPEADPRRLVYGYLREEGIEVPALAGGPRLRDRALLAEIPPDQLEVVSDTTVTEPLARPLSVLAARGSRWILHVPPEILQRAVARARQEIGDRTVTYRRVRALARWTRPPPVVPGPPEGQAAGS